MSQGDVRAHSNKSGYFCAYVTFSHLSSTHFYEGGPGHRSMGGREVGAGLCGNAAVSSTLHISHRCVTVISVGQESSLVPFGPKCVQLALNYNVCVCGAEVNYTEYVVDWNPAALKSRGGNKDYIGIKQECALTM